VGFCIDRAFADLQPYGHMAGHISVGGTSSICYCGRAGCLESAVSATSLHQAVLQHNSSGLLPIVPATARQVFTAASRGHKKAQAILQDFLTALQCGIDTYINLLAPDLIIIGGGLSSSLGGYLESLKSEKLLRPFKNYRVRLELSSLRERAGILGAAALFINKI
jgi:glucokinase